MLHVLIPTLVLHLLGHWLGSGTAWRRNPSSATLLYARSDQDSDEERLEEAGSDAEGEEAHVDLASKFEDLGRPCWSMLEDDYKTSGYQFKGTLASDFEGAAITTDVDLVRALTLSGKTVLATPAKVSVNLPGIKGLCIDKLHVHYGGNFNLETSLDQHLHKVRGMLGLVTSNFRSIRDIIVGAQYHGVKNLILEGKSSLLGFDKASLMVTHYGLKDTMMSLSTAIPKPHEFNVEATRRLGRATLGARFGNAKGRDLSVDMSAQYKSPSVFGALEARDRLKMLNGSVLVAVTPKLMLGASYDQRLRAEPRGTSKGLSKTPKRGGYTLGSQYHVAQDTILKAKLKVKSLFASLKHRLHNGFTLLGGMQYNFASRRSNCGFQVELQQEQFLLKSRDDPDRDP